MKVKNIVYHKVFSLGNFENEKIGVEIEVGEGENPIDALFEAKQYVEKSHQFNKRYHEYMRAKEVVKDEMNFNGRERKSAADFISDFEHNFNEFLNASKPAALASGN